jgi:hypothetical protein
MIAIIIHNYYKSAYTTLKVIQNPERAAGFDCASSTSAISSPQLEPKRLPWQIWSGPSSSTGLTLIEARESLQSPPHADHTSLQALFDVRRFY